MFFKKDKTKKYELTTETKHGLYRIKALKDFSDVKAGDLGGFIKSEKNLSQEGDAWVSGNSKVYGNAQVFGNTWVYGNARVYGDALVSDNALVCGDTRVYGDAEVYDNAQVFGDAEVSGDALVYGYARVYGNAEVFGNAWVYDNALVSGNALVYGNSKVYDNAQVYGDAQVYDYAQVFGDANVYGDALVYDNARVYGNTEVFGNAWVYGNAYLIYGKTTQDIFKDIKNYIKCSTYSCFIGDYILLYKRVNKKSEGEYYSCYDKKVIYKDNEILEIKDPDMDKNKSCTSGLHFSHPNYWNEGDTLIGCLIHIDDVITCQDGKVRARKCKVIGEVK